MPSLPAFAGPRNDRDPRDSLTEMKEFKTRSGGGGEPSSSAPAQREGRSRSRQARGSQRRKRKEDDDDDDADSGVDEDFDDLNQEDQLSLVRSMGRAGTHLLRSKDR